MRLHRRSIMFVVLALTFSSAAANWPTTPEENLSVAAAPNLYEGFPATLPYPNGGTLIALWQQGVGSCYQIINRFGNFNYPQLQGLFPGLPWEYHGTPKMWPDGGGGAIVAWKSVFPNPQPGIYAQRLDSLGNLLWGSSGVRSSPIASDMFDLSKDGGGGFLLAVAAGNVWAQRISSAGQILWGDSGVVVCSAPNAQTDPEITYDGSGGAYLVWNDQRPPYYPDGALFRQRLNSGGASLWTANGAYICSNVLFHDVIPDGLSGFILHTDPNHPDYNTVYRFDPTGAVLWTRDYVSWFSSARIVEGEAGHFYLGYEYQENAYAQRLDMAGNTYWPTLGSFAGAAMETSSLQMLGVHDYCYRYPYFFGLYKLGVRLYSYPERIYAQRLDSLGRRAWGESGVQLSYFNNDSTFYTLMDLRCSPDASNGIVGAYELWFYGGNKDVVAKHANGDGSLGGPPAPPVAHHPGGQIQSITGTLINYALAQSGEMQLELYNLLGQRVVVMARGFRQAGHYSASIDAKNLISGIYLIRLSTPSGTQLAKMVIIR